MAFTSIDFLAAIRTVCFGIKPKREIVGGFLDAGGKRRGFLRSKCGLTSIDLSGSVDAGPFGISPAGELVYDESSEKTPGFLLSG